MGKLVVVYGPNNIGKSTQMDRLEKRFLNEGITYSRLKYPIYDLKPTGPELNAILREGNPRKLNPEETQKIFAQNRRDFEPVLVEHLKRNRIVLAEDYKGTGFAWGLTFGVSFSKLAMFNEGLIDEDLAICLDGDRFSSGIERGHLHEQSDRWDLNRKFHQELSKKFGWEIVNANQLENKVEEEIWQHIQNRCLL